MPRRRTRLVVRRPVALALGFAAILGALGAGSGAVADSPAPPAFDGARASSPVVLTGAQVPVWSRLAATGVAQPYPSGTPAPTGDGMRSAHNGTIAVPPDARSGVDPDEIAAYRWDGSGWTEVPVQVDQRFPHFLANARSDFGIYSGTDPELTYSWAPDAHSAGAESWKQLFGTCSARYAADLAEVETAIAAGVVTLGPQESAEDWLAAMVDPVPTLDDDDELALDASDAGPLAPADATAPEGVDAASGQVVHVLDPVDPLAGGAIYLFLKPGGSRFTAADGHVQTVRDADADVWLDRDSFADGDPEALGKSNSGYGPNQPGTVCDDPTDPATARESDSGDRFPGDGWTVSTDLYRVTASGRWMVRGYQVTAPGTTGDYGADLIDRWKGRAFQQSPDSTISLVGFEDEQVNWEANSALLGWRAGPVRAIREIWGADSGTNVTKTETYYRGADTYRYRVRVHPIPPDGLYTSWDYNLGVAARYYDLARPEGVPIDGINDDTGNVDAIPVPGGPVPAYFDVTDPTLQIPTANYRPEEVAGFGDTGGAVYVFEMIGATSVGNPLVVPYYRDDACLDDGTGDDPVSRPWPGEASTDQRVRDGYTAQNGASSYDELECDPANGLTPFQGAIGSHGVHYFVTGDTDNAATPLPITEIDGQQWRFAAPMAEPTNVLVPYGLNVIVKLVAVVTPFSGGGASAPAPVPGAGEGPRVAGSTGSALPATGAEVPLLLAGALLVGGLIVRRRFAG